MSPRYTWGVLLLLLLAILDCTAAGAAGSCKPIPGDKAWPAATAWAQLNRTLDGRLIAAVPLAHVCHGSTYSEAECRKLRGVWDTPDVMIPHPTEFMASWFQNQTCTPFTDRSTPCVLGNHASYAVNVTGSKDVTEALAFAKKHSIRLVVKNSGHDFYGKNTGKGALLLWVHNLQHKEIIQAYHSPEYTGPAIKIGTGVPGGDAAAFAAKHGYRLVAGSCPTVAPAGGYTQGGGHSFLSGVYGFGADNVLSWEVVTADGRHVVATPTENRELYWALSGGGGGTYAVVLSMTSRVFPDGQIALGSLSFNTTSAGGVDQFWKAVETYHQELRSLVDTRGAVAEYLITNDTLSLFGLMAPDMTADQLQTAMQPMISALQKQGLDAKTVNLTVLEDRSYFKLYEATVEPLTRGNTIPAVVGGRFISRDNMAANTSDVHAALRHATANGTFIIAATALNSRGTARKTAAVADNAMQPAFKEAFVSLIFSTPWKWTDPWGEAVSRQRELINGIMPVVEAATPHAGAYANEGNWQQKNWQENFYGASYARLLKAKRQFDPDGIFYGLTAVGSEAWTQDSDGRLCRA